MFNINSDMLWEDDIGNWYIGVVKSVGTTIRDGVIEIIEQRDLTRGGGKRGSRRALDRKVGSKKGE